MGGFFSLDSKFMQVMSRVADLIILNVIYLVTCLPVVTIGAASTALYTVCFRLGTDREGSLVKGYFRAFRDEFRQATLIWLFLLLFGAASCVNIILFLGTGGWMHYLFFPFVLFLVVAGAYSAYALWDNSQVYAAADNVQAELLQFKPKAGADNGASFEELLGINPDVCAWVTLDNTAIDYPVVQGEDNFTYVNTDVYGDFSLAGSIFLDVNCDKNFTDPYSLLYGHHMEESKMFGDLDLYKDAEFFAENTTGELILPDRTYDLQTFACLLVPSSESAIFQPQRWDSDLQGLYTFAQENALNLNTETLAAMKAAGDDAQVLALSTCSTEFTDARTILLAWIIPSASDS